MGTNAIDLIRSSQGQARTTTPDAMAADKALQEWLDECAAMDSDRLEAYELAEEFYDGDHRTELTDRTREFLERSGVRFCENFCEPAVDMKAERLQVTGFDVAISGDETSETAAQLAEWLKSSFWEALRMDATQDTVHTTALMKGDAYGIIGWDNEAGAPTFSFNQPDMVKPVYAKESPDRMEYAVKVWDTDEAGPQNPAGRDITRLNVYFPDRIEKYFKLHRSANRGGWARWLDDEPAEGETATWPTPWVDAQGAPLGIPVVHFRNHAKGRCFGRSELAGVIPQNMLLNKQVLDLVMILDNQGWAQRWVSGVEGSVFTNAPGEIWTTPAKDAKFGQFDAADVAPVIEAIEATLSRMARRARLPLHMITGGDFPSGEALKSAESGLVSIVQNRAVYFGNSWEDAAAMALRLARLAGKAPVEVDPADLTISTQWENPVSRDEKGEAETAAIKKGLGVSKHTLLREMGYDPDEEADRRKVEAEEASLAAAKFFDGGDPSEDDPPPTPPGAAPPAEQ